MDVLFGTVLYPEAVRYAKVLSVCLQSQTISDFKVLVISDNVRTCEVTELFDFPRSKVDIVEYFGSDPPQMLRVKLIREAKDRKADVLVLGDADDVFSENRMEDSIKSLKSGEYDFAYNDIITEDGKNLFPVLPESVSQIGELLDYNYLGLSNTAVNMEKLNREFIDSLKDCDSFVFDWYLYSRMLNSGLKGGKCKGGSHTVYRIHDGSFAGIPKNTEENVKKEIEVKKKHYSLLSGYDSIFAAYSDAYADDRIRVRDDNAGLYWWNLTEPDFGGETYDY